MFQILIVEDDRSTSRLMQVVLGKEGYQIIAASNGNAALDCIEHHHIDLILMDVMMPEMDGFELTKILRESGNDIPILMVTALDLPENKCQGFLSGTDDYMVKPVNEDELLLRIKALLRRSKITSEHKLSVGDVLLDFDTLTVTKKEKKQTLPQKEFYLLFKLLSYPDKIFTRIQLMDEIWGMDSESADATVNVHINRLRKRFEGYTEFEIISVRGIGYKAVKRID
ncbi:MAG: response regulator transcription factor [Lachnospiraceae bacterium]